MNIKDELLKLQPVLEEEQQKRVMLQHLVAEEKIHVENLKKSILIKESQVEDIIRQGRHILRTDYRFRKNQKEHFELEDRLYKSFCKVAYTILHDLSDSVVLQLAQFQQDLGKAVQALLDVVPVIQAYLCTEAKVSGAVEQVRQSAEKMTSVVEKLEAYIHSRDQGVTYA